MIFSHGISLLIVLHVFAHVDSDLRSYFSLMSRKDRVPFYSTTESTTLPVLLPDIVWDGGEVGMGEAFVDEGGIPYGVIISSGAIGSMQGGYDDWAPRTHNARESFGNLFDSREMEDKGSCVDQLCDGYILDIGIKTKVGKPNIKRPMPCHNSTL